MSRCVWISQIYKYSNIVPIWGKNHFLLWMWEQWGSGPWWWQNRRGDIATRPLHVLQLPMADAITWENSCISNSNYIHWGIEIKWWTMYQAKLRDFPENTLAFLSQEKKQSHATMFWVQNTSRFGTRSLLSIKGSFVKMKWLIQKRALLLLPWNLSPDRRVRSWAISNETLLI